MRGPISEAVIIVALGFLIGGIAAAIIQFGVEPQSPSAPRPGGHTLYTKSAVNLVAGLGQQADLLSHARPPLPAALVCRG
jgi:hypothetical protein